MEHQNHGVVISTLLACSGTVRSVMDGSFGSPGKNMGDDHVVSWVVSCHWHCEERSRCCQIGIGAAEDERWGQEGRPSLGLRIRLGTCSFA